MRHLTLGLLPTLLALTSLTACFHAPETGRRAVILVPPGQEMQLGEEAFKEVLAKEKLCTNTAAAAAVTQIGKRVAAVSPKPGWQWDFRLFDAPKTANAFALPGGKVGVYTGLFGPAANEAGLAAVMGHEVAHAIARHGAERVTQSMLINLGLQAAEVTLGNAKHHDSIMGALGVGAQVGVVLPFSRDMESEADAIGLIYMAKAGYDPSEAVAFWERFKAASAGQAPPEFLSTHPANETRIAHLKAALPKAMVAYQASARSGKGQPLTIPTCPRAP